MFRQTPAFALGRFKRWRYNLSSSVFAELGLIVMVGGSGKILDE